MGKSVRLLYVQFPFPDRGNSLYPILEDRLNFLLPSISFSIGAKAPSGPQPPHSRGSQNTQRHTTVGRTPLDEWSARRRELNLKTHDNYKRQTSMHPEGFEPTISAGERPQTFTLDHATTGTGFLAFGITKYYLEICTPTDAAWLLPFPREYPEPD